ncbi:MAG: metallophosphoesterase [Chloroflexi bacterium]|nr:metallophosphoesterase [Chloroflexota bacterium]
MRASESTLRSVQGLLRQPSASSQLRKAKLSLPSQGLVTLGLIADTHVPDRSRRLHPAVLPAFEKAGVSTILHAGDISVPRVLRQLGEVAPVLAVRGNRDWFGFKDLPMQRIVQFGQRRIGLTHGHGNWRLYVSDKLRYLLRGPQSFEVALKRSIALMADVDVVVFGHNHEPMVKDMDDLLVINPGSACCQVFAGKPPSVGLLHLDRKKMWGEVVYLE